MNSATSKTGVKAKSRREEKEKEEEDKTGEQYPSHEGRKRLSDHVTGQISEMASQIQKLQTFMKGKGKGGW